MFRITKFKKVINQNYIHINSNSSSSSSSNRSYCTSPKVKLDEEVPKQQQQPIVSSTATSNILDIPTTPPTKTKSCWCVLSCKLVGKRIASSQIKPIKYEDERAILLSSKPSSTQTHSSTTTTTTTTPTKPEEYKLDLELPLSQSRKELIKELILAKDQYILEQKREQEEINLEKLKKEKEKQDKQLFQTDDSAEERDFPVLTDDDTSIGPIHVLYKNQWISTIVERIETSNKDNEPSFILKIKTPIKLSSEFTFSFESIHSTLDRLLSTGKVKADCEFDKMFLTTVGNDKEKEFTNWINTESNNNNSSNSSNDGDFKKCLLLKEALIRIKNEILPSIGFDGCSIDLVLSKDSIVGCKEGRQQLEFPDGTYQLVLEIDSNEESIWAKSPESVEKILYLYTMMLDSLVSMGHTENIPLSVSYL